MKSLGQVCYEAYIAHSHGKSLISGQALPDWTAQREDIQQAWEACAQALWDEIYRRAGLEPTMREGSD